MSDNANTAPLHAPIVPITAPAVHMKPAAPKSFIVVRARIERQPRARAKRARAHDIDTEPPRQAKAQRIALLKHTRAFAHDIAAKKFSHNGR
jgi:ribosomal protein L15E